MELYEFIKPLGVITYAVLFITVLSGFLKWKFKYHKAAALGTLMIAGVHAIIVFVSH